MLKLLAHLAARILFTPLSKPTINVKVSLRSFDNGTNWSSFTEPNDADLGISSTDFTRGQAWYNLILRVNPLKASEVIIGGIDLFRSTEAGNNWNQISRWSIRNANLNQLSCSYVHADQHQIIYNENWKICFILAMTVGFSIHRT